MGTKGKPASLAAAAWLALSGLLALPASSARAATLEACADQAEIPPFTYARRGGPEPLAVVGASVDLLRKIGQAHGWDVHVTLMPWARCLAQVADNRVALALNADQQDTQGLLLSKPYFSLHNLYYHSRRARPQGLALHTLADARRYHVCGLGGYRFEAYGIATASVDRGTTGYEQLISKLHLGRCDLFIDSRETMAGQYLVNPRLRSMLVDGTLVGQPLPDMPLRTLHFAVAASGAQGKALLDSINQGLARLEKTHEMAKLIDHYLE